MTPAAPDHLPIEGPADLNRAVAQHPGATPAEQNIRVHLVRTPDAQAPIWTGEAVAADLDPLEFVRTVATARTIMPQARVRLSAGRQAMSASTQALCFLAGANSIFVGEKLLTTSNPAWDADTQLFERLGLKAESGPHSQYVSA